MPKNSNKCDNIQQQRGAIFVSRPLKTYLNEHEEFGSQSGDTNLYGYVGQDPVNAVDPKGTDATSYLDGGHALLRIGQPNGPQTYVDFSAENRSLLGVLPTTGVLSIRNFPDNLFPLIQTGKIPLSPEQDIELLARAKNFEALVNAGKYKYMLIPIQPNTFNCSTAIGSILEGK